MDRSSSTSASEGAPDAPVTPRPAATVILVRDGIDGRIETFMVRRDPRSRFAADAFVFPGGTVGHEDRGSSGQALAPGLSADQAHRRLTERGSEPPEDRDLSLGLHVAAVRELFEEAGILLASNAGADTGVALSPETCARLAALRPEIQQRKRDLGEVVADLGLELVPEELVYFSHWITPEPSPRRYDTRFFVVEDRPGQTASHCGVETVDGEWVAPADLLDRFERGEVTLVSVTVDHLQLLARFRTVADLLQFARTKPVRTVQARRNREGWDLGGNGAPW